MPPLSPIPIIADLRFLADGLKLPVDWDQPQDETDEGAKMYPDGFQPNELVGIPKLIPPYFIPASENKLHVDSCDDIGNKFRDFCHQALDMVKGNFDLWRLQAKFKDLKVMAVCAIGTPGCLDAPKLKDMALWNAWVGMDSNEKAYIKAVKEGVSKCVEEWAAKVMVPGLPWYPAFAAYPGPTAPPMPNVPMPLITCPSATMTKIVMPDELKNAMVDALDQGVKDEDPDKQHETLFAAIGTALALAFLMWLPSQQIMLVLGKGPVPVYAPPYVPVGPVIGGDNIAAPGHLAV